MSPAQVQVLPDREALARRVAEWFVARLAAVQALGRTPSVVLTGGSIAEELYRAAATLDSSAVDWSNVDFWWGDERYVPADSPDRNDRQVELDLLDLVGADPARVHAMPAADEQHPDVASAATDYSATMRVHGSPVHDLVLLGLGPDGHVASLFPGFAQLDVDDEVAVPVTDSPKPPPERISLTFPELNRTREVWFVVAGEDKSGAVARALAETGTVAETPARGISCEETIWWLDEAAAAEISSLRR